MFVGLVVKMLFFFYEVLSLTLFRLFFSLYMLLFIFLKKNFRTGLNWVTGSVKTQQGQLVLIGPTTSRSNEATHIGLDYGLSVSDSTRPVRVNLKNTTTMNMCRVLCIVFVPNPKENSDLYISRCHT